MLTIVQRIEIDAGHRLLKHEGKCRFVHGHRFVFEVRLRAPALDEVGRILDFGQVKASLGGWLNDNMDHGFIAQEGDPIVEWLRADNQKVYVLQDAPTAENISQHVFGIAQSLIEPPIEVVGLRLWETPNGSAEISL